MSAVKCAVQSCHSGFWVSHWQEKKAFVICKKMSKSNQNRTNLNKGKIFTFDFVMNWSFKQPTCSKRLMESWSTFLSKRSSSGDLNAAPSLDPYSAAKLLNNKRRNSFSCVRYFCYRRTRNGNEVKNVKEGHWCHLHNTKNSQKQTVWTLSH